MEILRGTWAAECCECWKSDTRDMDTDMLGTAYIFGHICVSIGTVHSPLSTVHWPLPTCPGVNVKHETKHFVRLACKIV